MLARRSVFVALLVAVFPCCSAAPAATTCSKHVDAAVQTIEGDGIGVVCCDPAANGDCKTSLIGSCADANATWAFCLGAGDAHACAISYGTDPGLPCGAYTGSIGKTFGMSPIAAGYAIPLQNDDVQGALRRNWGRLSTISDAGLCCSAGDVAGAAPCHVGKVPTLEENHCNAGEYELKCFGTPTHGLCTVFSNETSTTEIGQYYFVNFDADAPKPPPSVSSPTNTGTSTDLAATAGADSHKSSGVNPVAVAVPVAVVVLLLLALGVAFFIWRRRRAQAAYSGATSTVPYDAQSASLGVGASPINARRASSMQQQASSTGHIVSFHSSQPSLPRGGKYAYRAEEHAPPPEPQLPTYSMYSDDQGQLLRS